MSFGCRRKPVHSVGGGPRRDRRAALFTLNIIKGKHKWIAIAARAVIKHLGCWRKPDHPEETHSGTGRTQNHLAVERHHCATLFQM